MIKYTHNVNYFYKGAMMSSRYPVKQAIVTLIAVVGLGMGLGACSSSSTQPEPTATSTSAQDPSAAWSQAVEATITARKQVDAITNASQGPAAWKAYVGTLAPLEQASQNFRTALENERDKVTEQVYKAGIESTDASIAFAQAEQKIAGTIQKCLDNGDIDKCDAELDQSTKNFETWRKAQDRIQALYPSPTS